MATPSTNDVSEIELVLKTTALFSSLDKEQSRQLAQKAQIFIYDAGHVVMQQGAKTMPAFYIVLHGQALLHREGEAKVVLFSGNRFGQELLQEAPTVVAPFTVQAKSKIRCATLTYLDMTQVFDVEHVDKGVSVAKHLRRKAKTNMGVRQGGPEVTPSTKAGAAADQDTTAPKAMRKTGKISTKNPTIMQTVNAKGEAGEPTASQSSDDPSREESPLAKNPKKRTDNVAVVSTTASDEKETIAGQIEQSQVAENGSKMPQTSLPEGEVEKEDTAKEKSPRAVGTLKTAMLPPVSPHLVNKPKAVPISPRAFINSNTPLSSPKRSLPPMSLPRSPLAINKPRPPPMSSHVESSEASMEAELFVEETMRLRSPVGRKVGKLGQDSFSFLNGSQNLAPRQNQVGKIAIQTEDDSAQSPNDGANVFDLVELDDPKTRFEQSLSKFENSLRSTNSAGLTGQADPPVTMQLQPGLHTANSNRSLRIDESRNQSKPLSPNSKRRGLIKKDSLRSLASADAKEFRRRLRKTAKELGGKESLHHDVIEEDKDKEIIQREVTVEDLDTNHASGLSLNESASSFSDSVASNESKTRFEESLHKFQRAESEQKLHASSSELLSAEAVTAESNENAETDEPIEASLEPSTIEIKPSKREKSGKKDHESSSHDVKKDKKKKKKKKAKGKKSKEMSKDRKECFLDRPAEQSVTETELSPLGYNEEKAKVKRSARKGLRYPSNDTDQSWTSYKGRFKTTRSKFEATVRPRPPLDVAQKRIDLPLDYKAPFFQKTKEDERQISRALSSCFALKSLPKRNLKALIAAFEPQKAKAGAEIIGKGKKEDCFYVVKDGEVEVSINGENVRNVKANETFGQSNLFDVSSEHKDVTATAVSQTSLFKVNHTTYRSILQVESKAIHERKRELINQLPLLKRTPKECISKMVDVMKPIAFEDGETIPTDIGGNKRLYVVDEGRIRHRDENGQDQVAKSGDIVGETYFVGDSDTPKHFQADGDVTAFYIDMESFEKAIGPVKTVIVPKAKEEAQMELRSVVMDTKILRFEPKMALTILERNSILALINDRTYEKGDVILEANQEVPANFFFLKKGMVEAYDMATSQTSMTFVMGPNVLGTEIFRAAKAASSPVAKSPIRLVASETVVIGVLSAKEYLATQAFYLKKPIHQGWHPGKAGDIDDSDFDSDSDEEFADYLEEDDYGRIKHENLVKKTLLGEGGFGQVWLVYDKTDPKPKPYAFKVQSKYELTVAGDADVAVREKNIMRELRHPNVIRLLASYQDETFIFFLMNLIQGGELYSLLHPIDEDMDNPVGLGEDKARFYAFGIADALAYLHRKGYVYRDLKPENVLIDSHGHPILCDFGLAKKLEDQEKTFTMRGTPGYLSPESVLNIGHSYSADHWSLGILICEMICGESPFFFFGIDSVDLYRRIAEEPFDPPDCASDEAIDIMDGLLTKDPSVRLGSLTNGEADIIKHKWFQGMDPTAMRRRKIEAPWKPSLKDPFDASNFEDWTDLEDKTTQTYPTLTHKEAAVFDNF